MKKLITVFALLLASVSAQAVIIHVSYTGTVFDTGVAHFGGDGHVPFDSFGVDPYPIMGHMDINTDEIGAIVPCFGGACLLGEPGPPVTGFSGFIDSDNSADGGPGEEFDAVALGADYLAILNSNWTASIFEIEFIFAFETGLLAGITTDLLTTGHSWLSGDLGFGLLAFGSLTSSHAMYEFFSLDTLHISVPEPGTLGILGLGLLGIGLARGLKRA